MNYYEFSFLTSNIPTKEKDTILKEVEEEIKKLEGRIEDKFIEKKRFAYPVKKHTEGFLGIFSFFLAPERIEEFKKNITKNEKIIRIMIERKKAPKEKKRKPETKGAKKKEKVELERLDEKLDEILK